MVSLVYTNHYILMGFFYFYEISIQMSISVILCSNQLNDQQLAF